MEDVRHDIESRKRADKAKRLIAHLDRHFGRQVTREDVASWKEANWRRTYDRAGERWNPRQPFATVKVVLALLDIRERAASARHRIPA